MSTWTSYGVARVVAGEGDLVSYPMGYSKDGSLPWVMFCHGAGSTGEDNLQDLSLIVGALAEKYVVGSFDFGGEQTWGNVDLADFDAAVDWLRTEHGASEGPGVMVGVSMGSLTMCVFARSRPDEVIGMVGIIPGFDLSALHVGNRGGYAAYVDAAYGGYDSETDGPDHSPIEFAEDLSSIPIQTWYASDDPIWLASEGADFATTHGNVDRNNVGALGHSQESIDAVDISALVAFVDGLF